jgi:hypothetical protein
MILLLGSAVILLLGSASILLLGGAALQRCDLAQVVSGFSR